ncbi:Rne/Rng family ribonuclease [Aquibacillus salsiterrae]|uniref:Rne/Rng family ribonuclease n=1 Tax=Aquibacillus salsiterrae TaxID=2950439 RepID=A0A9X3WDX9_9BACI|nr:Rne/Rng family ribonuclease [Aquibacillus salsiterrae]MDC3415664.1 Rne/Rng family ribonuclease [Aquibacillus salsiterrae]
MVSIYIQAKTTEKLGIVVDENVVKEIHIDRPELSSLVGNIYVARVKVVDRSLQAVFVDIGLEKLGFLQSNEIPMAKKMKKPIESVITEGERIVVQVQKDAYGNKGARLTANITLPGIDIVYLPNGDYVAASRKLSDETKDELRQQISNVKTGTEGAIIRTSAQKKTAEEVVLEFKNLRNQWEKVNKLAKNSPVPRLVFHDQAVSDRLIRKFSPDQINHIRVDQPELANRIRNNYPTISEKITWVENIENLLPRSIKQILEQAVTQKVTTASGVELVIDETEALTVIDVNSAGFYGKGTKEHTLLQVNMNAAKEIANQLRLRNISGAIVIDFIGMKSVENQQSVLTHLKKKLYKDPIRTEVYGFTKLGLVEMTRKRESPPLSYVLLDKGKTSSFTKQSLVYDLERELFNYQQSDVEALLIEIHPTIYKLLFDMIDKGRLAKKITKEVYMKRTNGVLSYHIALTGSHLLIKEYIARNSGDTIDKVF